MEYKGSKDFLRCERRGEIYTDTSADYSLPDYNGDVRRILYTNAQVHPSGSFENGDSVDFSGIVAYDIVYVDSENKINTASLSSDYDFTVKCNADGFSHAHADITVADYSLRLLGPRKISARATVVADVTVTNEESISPVGEIFCGEVSAEVDTERILAYYSKRSGEIEREYAEELCRLDGAVLDEVEVIYTNAEYSSDGISPDGEGVNIKGNLRVFALVKADGGAIRLEENNIRVDERLPFEGDMSGLKLLPVVTVGSVRHNVNADENGCSVVANVILRLCAECIGNQSVEIVTDAYSRSAEVENEYGEFRFCELSSLVSEKQEIAGVLSRDALEIENVREITLLRADASVEDCKVADGVASISGEVLFCGVVSGSDAEGMISYYPFKNPVEFAINVNINCQNAANLMHKIKIECRDLSASIDENKIELSAKAELEICTMLACSAKILTSSNIVEGTEESDVKTKITVYYPERGERLFDIAKKFRTTVEKISADNQTAVRAMSDGDYAAPARLLIY